jgi:hypothetical protein
MNIAKMIIKFRELFWPILDPLAPINVRTVTLEDCKFSEKDIDMELSYVEAYKASEDERRKSVESKATIFIGTFSVAVTVLINLAKEFFNNLNVATNKYDSILIILITLIIVYLCRAIQFSIKALERRNYSTLGFPDFMFTDSTQKKKLILVKQYNSIKKNQEEINIKVDYMVMAQEYFKRAVTTVIFLTVVFFLRYSVLTVDIKSKFKKIVLPKNLERGIIILVFVLALIFICILFFRIYNLKIKSNKILYCNEYSMKKIFVYFGIVTVLIYLWFGILPEVIGFSLPTGGWDWLDFTGIIIGLLISTWGIIEAIKNNSVTSREQQIMASMPCLDVDPVSQFNAKNPKNVFRRMDFSEKIVNDGYILLRSNEINIPLNFTSDCNIKIRNIGLSPAFNIIVTLFKLEKVNGVNCLDDITKKYIDNFYDKVCISNFIFYEDQIQKNDRWIISPAYNLNNVGDEFNLVFDLSKVTNENHCILRFDYEDVYGTKYYQMLYLYLDINRSVAYLPVSSVMKLLSDGIKI